MTPYTQSQSNSCDCGPFFLDVAGQFQRDALSVQFSDQRRPTNDKVEQVIEKTWIEQLERARINDGVLYNGRLARLISYEPQKGHLGLTLGEVGYKELLGTNLMNPSLRYVHGAEVLGDALGVSAAVLTSDGYILMGRRSERVAYHAGKIHPFGGIIELGSDGQPPHPFDSIVSELCEELGVTEATLLENLCVGLVRDKKIVQPELIFDIALKADVQTVRAAAALADDAHEHRDIVAIRNEGTSVVVFLQQQFGDLTPVGIATLLLHGLRAWGSGWFTAARGYLRKVI